MRITLRTAVLAAGTRLAAACGGQAGAPAPGSAGDSSRKAMALVNADLRADASIYPTPGVKARLQPNLSQSTEFTRLLSCS